jgi:23S rRNA (guanosine2251-2'-O)-methyltransferase
VIDRPVLTIATKGAFGRPEPVAAPREERGRDERPQGKRPPIRQMREPRAPVARHDIDAPRGTIWLYGIHAIGAALQNPQRRLRRLLLTEEAEVAMAAAFPKPWPIPSESTERARLDLLLGQNVVHQGAALLADPLGSPSLVQALERPGPVLVLDQVSDPRNVGAILRSAAVFGCACVITQDRNAPDESGALAKAASGALEKIPLLRAVNIARTLVALKAAGCWVVGLDASGNALSGPALAGRRVALVLGSEGEGMRRLTRETCDELAGIPMIGGAGSAIDSLNVSAAGTVALYELSRKA